MTNDHDVEPPFSIQSIISRASSSTSVGTVSTATSLIASFAGQLSLEERVAIKSHNSSNQQTIRSELTGEEVTIPWCGFDKRLSDVSVESKKRRSWAWWNVFGYGLRVGNRVYCTVRRKQGGCFQDYASNKMESTSLINHLISDHFGLTQSRHNIIMKLLLSQQEQDPTYKTKYPGGENEYNEQFFQNCITTESKLHLDKYEQEQNDINKMNKLPFTRESFLDLFTDFVIANNLPMVFSSNNVMLERLLQFSNRSNANDEKTISYNSMLIPSSNTKLKELIIEKHKNQKKLVKEKLKQQKYINFTTDLWKSETNQYFMGITAHFIDQKWEPQQITIALKHMKNASHAGNNLGKLFMEVLEDYEIKNNLFCLTTDNASNNGKLADYLEDMAERDSSFKFKRNENLISCLAHVINIVCHDLIDKGLQSRAPIEDADMENVMKDVESDSSKKDNPVVKLRKGCGKIRLSSQLNSIFQTNKNTLNLPDLSILIDCQSRWNSTKVMIDRFLILKEAYRLTINSEDELREDCSLNNAQIEYIINIQKILTKFENITSWLSSQQYTTINKTIVLYNDLFTRLEKFQQKNPSLSAAIDLCITKLSKYYSPTDRTDVYACATMVDPSLKFSYWKEQEWETDIIEEQISRCEKSFSSFLADYYTHELRTSDSSEALAFRIEAGPSTANAIPVNDAYNCNDDIDDYNIDDDSDDEDDDDDDMIIGISRKRLRQSQQRQRKVFLTGNNSQSSIIRNYVESNAELSIYIQTDHTQMFGREGLAVNRQQEVDGEDNEQDDDANIKLGKLYATKPLKFWKQHEKLFPTLSLFARKYLSIPATSVPSERLFSQAKHTINNKRARLKPEMAEKIVLLSCWQKEVFVEK